MYICSCSGVIIHLFKNWNKSVVKKYHIGLFWGETYGYGICGRLGFRIKLIVPTQFERKIYPASYKKCSGISSRAVNGRRLSAFVQISGLFHHRHLHHLKQRKGLTGLFLHWNAQKSDILKCWLFLFVIFVAKKRNCWQVKAFVMWWALMCFLGLVLMQTLRILCL